MNESVLKKLRQLRSLLLALCGSQGVSELDADDLDVLLDHCLELTSDALSLSREEVPA